MYKRCLERKVNLFWTINELNFIYLHFKTVFFFRKNERNKTLKLLGCVKNKLT